MLNTASGSPSPESGRTYLFEGIYILLLLNILKIYKSYKTNNIIQWLKINITVIELKSVVIML